MKDSYWRSTAACKTSHYHLFRWQASSRIWVLPHGRIAYYAIWSRAPYVMWTDLITPLYKILNFTTPLDFLLGCI